MRGKSEYGNLSRDVEHEFSAVHVEKTWALLAEKFCFNVKAWKQEFRSYYQKQDSRMSEQQAFVEFGAISINPLLNSILKRKSYHNTWGNILAYVVRG